MDLSALPRMSVGDVVTAALAGIVIHEMVIGPGVEDGSLLEESFAASSPPSTPNARNSLLATPQ